MTKDRMSIDSVSPIVVCCCYAPQDKLYLDELKLHLSGIQRQGLFHQWQDYIIYAGHNRAEQANELLEVADVVLLLISSFFLRYNDEFKDEIRHLMKKHSDQEVRVIPILLSDTDWRNNTEFGSLAALPSAEKPVVCWSDSDDAFCDIARDLWHIFNALHKGRKQREPLLNTSDNIGTTENRVRLPYKQAYENPYSSERKHTLQAMLNSKVKEQKRLTGEALRNNLKEQGEILNALKDIGKGEKSLENEHELNSTKIYPKQLRFPKNKPERA